MKQNLKVLVWSVVIGLAIAIHEQWVLGRYEGEGFGGIGIALGYIFVGAVLIPIVFGIVGFAISPERRFKRAFSWLGISFAVILGLNLLIARTFQPLRYNIESDAVITDKTINSYEKCATMGYPIMKSLPLKCRAPGDVIFIKNELMCIQVITEAKNPQTGETREFPTPCDVPEEWIKVR